MSNTPSSETVDSILKDYVWGLCCKDCDGGGWDYENDRKCGKCQGRGIHSWETEDATRHLRQAIEGMVERVISSNERDQPANEVDFNNYANSRVRNNMRAKQRQRAKSEISKLFGKE